MAPPANWTTVPVAGQYIYPDGTPASGTVTFTNTLYLRDPDLNYVIVPKPVQFILDGTGAFSGNLQATDDPDLDPSFYYLVTEVIGGITTTFPLLVPRQIADLGDTLQMADVDRNATIPPEPEVYVRTINGMYGDVYTADFDLPTPSDTVVNETSFGQASNPGTSPLLSRGDHTHGTPAAPSIPSAYASTPTSNSVTASGSAGASAQWARGDHQHAGPGFGVVAAQTSFGASSGNGAATTVARSDHTHGTPATPANDTSTQKSIISKAGSVIGTRQQINLIEGSNVTMTVADNSGSNRVDVTVNSSGGSPASSVVSETAFGQSSAVGSSGNFARQDHTHGTPTAPTASSVGAVPTTTATGFNSGLLSARPAAGTANRFYYSTDLRTLHADNGTDWIQLDQEMALPKSWTAIGHSYLQFNAASYNQRSRLDSIIRNRWGAESTNWTNLAIAGSRATVEGAAQGGWATVIREINKLPGKTSPYTGSDGGALICTGINDLGTLGGATTQMQTAFGHAIRFMISRWRASTIFETTASNTAFGGTWTTETTQQDRASGGEWRYHATTGGTVTITLPADYNGEPVAICLIGRFGNLGGTVTWSGTAGVTGTTSTDNIMPSGSLSNIPVLKRVTNLTSANAGQTIIGTVTANSGLVYYDGWWLEALEAPPVIVCNIPRLTASGYSTKYSSWNAAPAQGSCDADVAAFNTVITNVRNEFDGMVQIADIDSKLNKTASLFTDGLHPNERGAALCADAIDDARRRLTLTGVKSAALNMNMAPRYAGGMRMRRRSGFYHTADASAITTYTPVAGDMFALPFEVTEMDEQYARWALTVSTAGSTTSTIRWGIFADYMNKGYPDTNLQELTIGTGALAVTNATGPVLNPSAQYTWWPDIGQYYFVLKIETVGTSQVLAALQGPSYAMPAASSTGDIRTANGGGGVAWKITGQATGAFPSTFPAGAVPANVAPYVGALKS